MRIAICAARAEEKVAKKAAKKRKSVGGDEEGGGKRSKGEKKAAGAPVVQGGNARVGLIAKAVADELKAAEEKRKAGGMSEAVKSLYAGRKGKEEENFITRGTFTRVSFPICSFQTVWFFSLALVSDGFVFFLDWLSTLELPRCHQYVHLLNTSIINPKRRNWSRPCA